ncbi:hypothetical protein B0O99DRAFT_49164 [Bisporella sp. PMI_857]|nr:hypothetical protein B0O99DRAFT_49164 [Bisporella sp. PMI_857]
MIATFFMDYNMSALLWQTAAPIQEPSPVVVKSATQMSPQELLLERRRKEHEEYKKERDSIPNKLKRTFAECLGDISRDGLVIRDEEGTRSTWAENSVRWYMTAYNDIPVLADFSTISQFFLALIYSHKWPCFPAP